MNRNRSWLAVTILLCAAPALAVPPASLANEAAAVELERLVREAYGLVGGEAKYRNYGDGAHSLSIPVPGHLRGRLAPRTGEAAQEAAALFLLATGVQGTEPTLPSPVASQIIDTDAGYNHWAVVYNDGNSDTTKKATIKAKCAKTSRNDSRQLLVESGFIVVWWYQPAPFGVEAVCSQEASIQTGKPSKVTQYFLAIRP
jgi:hypothetical protein